MPVALARRRRRAANMLLIPDASSVAHLRENLAAGEIVLSEAVMGELEGIGAA
jgi:pyridoxine 4-dehydrogenase